jgi:hypothetical protein
MDKKESIKMSKLLYKQTYMVYTGFKEEYWFNGVLHRDPKTGPACIWANGTKEYWLNGKLHRNPKDGPACIWADGRKEYWFNGKQAKAPK